MYLYLCIGICMQSDLVCVFVSLCCMYVSAETRPLHEKSSSASIFSCLKNLRRKHSFPFLNLQPRIETEKPLSQTRPCHEKSSCAFGCLLAQQLTCRPQQLKQPAGDHKVAKMQGRGGGADNFLFISLCGSLHLPQSAFACLCQCL